MPGTVCCRRDIGREKKGARLSLPGSVSLTFFDLKIVRSFPLSRPARPFAPRLGSGQQRRDAQATNTHLLGLSSATSLVQS